MNFIELREKSVSELEAALKETLKKLNMLKIAKANNSEFKKTHRFSVLRKEIAWIHTLICEKEKATTGALG